METITRRGGLGYLFSSHVAGALACAVSVLLAACGGGGDGGANVGPGDADGDGLASSLEVAGWVIRVDRSGYGPEYAELLVCTSDPNLADTDGDGLDDGEEYELRTDPRSPDTDGDSLDDAAEFRQWHTNPSSVDTDGDARGAGGNLAPNAVLFDGMELSLLHTSPTLRDTDGDRRWDSEEYDSSAYSPLIAELPEVDFMVDGDLDVRLRVEYLESVGSESEYGTRMKIVQTDIERSSTVKTHQAHVGFESDVDETGASTHFEASYDFESRETFERESRREATRESHQYQRDSYESTEVASAGEISLPLRVENSGLSTFELDNLIVTVLHWTPSQAAADGNPAGSFRALATLRPQVEGLTLAPGERTPVLEVSDQDVNPAVVKEFLAQPNALVLQPAAFDLSDEAGIDFDFLTENTFQRTALVEFDFGDTVETYRVATNVLRDPDGGYSGLRMQEAMEQILDIPYETTEQPPGSGFTKLRSVRDREEGPDNSFWAVIGSREEHWDDPAVQGDSISFEDIVLLGGDNLRFVLVRDVDQDGLYAEEEAYYGTSDTESDTDADGLSDATEIKVGWTVEGVGLERSGVRVYSDPLLEDTDDDGLGDDQEFAMGSDPTDPDTDGDDLFDGVDPDPLRPALTLYVDANPNDGAWTPSPPAIEAWQIFEDLEAALAYARDEADEPVSQIWIARGTYAPESSYGFELLPRVGVYGGFWGGESKRAARDSDPWTNSTVLAPEEGEARRIAMLVMEPGDATTLDGFTIRGGNPEPALNLSGSGLNVKNGSVTLRNLLFYDNTTEGYGGGVYLGRTPEHASATTHARIESCTFLFNRAQCSDHSDQNEPSMGGAIYCQGVRDGVTTLELVDSRFSYNASHYWGGAVACIVDGDHVYAGSSARLEMTRCDFNANRADDEQLQHDIHGDQYGMGGAVRARHFNEVQLESCQFVDNEVRVRAGGAGVAGGAIAATIPPEFWEQPGGLDMTNCLVADNKVWTNSGGDEPYAMGGGIWTSGGSDLSLVNCTVSGNVADNTYNEEDSYAGGVMCGGFTGHYGHARVINSILSGNVDGHSWDDSYEWQNNIHGAVDVRFSCLESGNAATVPGVANTWQAPAFLDPGSGNYRLDPTDPTSEPCIDAGLDVVDIHPREPGPQPLPATDLDGNARIQAGSVDQPQPVVDMGCYEVPSQ